MTDTITMHIEKPSGVIIQHGYHLGTDLHIARSFVEEKLRTDHGIVSIALRQNGKVLGIYDFRSLKSTILYWARANQRELISFLGNVFTQAECRDALHRLPMRPENAVLWGVLKDAELGDFVDWPE